MKRVNEKKQRGTALVEFAIVLPLLLLLVMGIVELGIGLYDKAVITNASREGARAGVVLRSGWTTPQIQTVIQSAALLYSQANLLTFGAPSTAVLNPPPTGINAGTGNPLTVTVSYQ